MPQAMAVSVLNRNKPINMPVTLIIDENNPQKNMMLVSLDAWKVEPYVDMII